MAELNFTKSPAGGFVRILVRNDVGAAVPGDIAKGRFC